MTNTSKQPNKPNFPEAEAVKKLRDKYFERKSKIVPSTDMNEVIGKKPKTEEKPIRKIARSKRAPDVDLS